MYRVKHSNWRDNEVESHFARSRVAFIRDRSEVCYILEYATPETLAACETLGDEERKRERGAFFGSIHHTLSHLLLADRLWLQRFASQQTRFAALDAATLALPPGVDYISVDAYPDWVELQQARDALDEVIERWLA